MIELPRFVPRDLPDKGAEPEPFIPGPFANRRTRVKLRTPQATKRRQRWRRAKVKKKRIYCQECNKRFTPKRSSCKFCSNACRNKSNRKEHKLFLKLNIYFVWARLPPHIRQRTNRLAFMRNELAFHRLGLRR